MNEFELISALRAMFDSATAAAEPGTFVVPNGDDAAVMRSPSGLMTLTTDALVEEVHFSFRICSRRDAGYRAVAVNLSDLAAMGAKPLGILVSLVIPDRMTDADVLEVGAGIADAVAEYGAPVAGGNITRTDGPLVVSITAMGDQAVPPPLRSGAIPGDEIWVSGHPGDAAVGLHLLLNCPELASMWPALVDAYRRPRPRLDLTALFSVTDVHAAIDISDGLIADLGHIVHDSGVGASVTLENIPVSADARAFCETAPACDVMDRVLYGGDDYQLLLAAPAQSAAAIAGAGFTRIGLVRKESGIELVEAGRGFVPRGSTGWQHR